MKLLILGGTVFLGRHIVDDALKRGHEVTLFNRGQHNADLYPQIEKLRGDRDGNLDALTGRQFALAMLGIDPLLATAQLGRGTFLLQSIDNFLHGF